MALDRRNANLETLDKTKEVQDKTLEVVWRVQRDLAETETLGHETLAKQKRQGEQIDGIIQDVDSVNSKLKQSQALQNRFDLWGGNWLGFKKHAAMKEASAEIQRRNQAMQGSVHEVFQNQEWSALTRSWHDSGLVQCIDPSVSCDDLFDPAVAESAEAESVERTLSADGADGAAATAAHCSWHVDYSLAGVDTDGWTYAHSISELNKKGSGEAAAKWNSCARRRKWRYIPREALGSGGALASVQARNAARKAEEARRRAARRASEPGSGPGGYVPRSHHEHPQHQLQATGLTSAGMSNHGLLAADQRLDVDAAAGLQRAKDRDADIDRGIAAIGQQVDNLGHIASEMHDETVAQNSKLNRLQNAVDGTSEKQTVVNARQRYLLK